MEGATPETVRAGVCVCLQLIPVQLALRQGFQNPPAGPLAETNVADGGMDRRREGESGADGMKEDKGEARCDSLDNTY